MPKKLRLTQILKEHKDRCGSIAKLSEAIREANGGEKSVDQRKLAAIINGEVKTLSISLLEALDMYLTPFGQSLADTPLFDADTILRALVLNGRVAFFIATRMREEEQRAYMSVFDVRGFSSIVGAINQRWPATRVSLREDEARPSFACAPPERDWGQLLQDDKQSYCCIGLLPPMAEHMVAEMFGVCAFAPPWPAGPSLPFHFVRRPRPTREPRNSEILSCLAFSVDDLARMVAAKAVTLADESLPQAIKRGDAQAFLVGSEVHPVYPNSDEGWNDYGVVVAQRRPGGEVWCVIGGLSGPGTLAAAEALSGMSGAMPESELGRPSRPVYAVVEAAVEVDPDKTFGDNRRVVDQRVIVEPTEWEPTPPNTARRG